MPPSSDACDIFSNILTSPVAVPQRNDSGIKLDLASIFQLPDDLLHIPGTSEDDLISVVLRDIQPSPFDNFTDDELSVYDCANSTFNIGSDEFDTMIAGGKEATIAGWSTMLVTDGNDVNYEADNGLLEFQSTKVAHTKPRVWANGTAAKQADSLGHQVQSDLFHSMPSYIGERHLCDLVGPSIPLQQLDGARGVQQAPNHCLAEPHTRRSNRRITNTRSPTRLSRKDMTTNESPVYHNPSAMPQHVDAGSASPDSTSVDENGNDVDDRRPSPTHEVIHPRVNPTSKRKTKLKPTSDTPLRARSEDVTVDSRQIPPSPTQSSPVQSSPIQEYLRPIRGRPRRSKAGEQQSNPATPSTSAANDVLQPSHPSVPTIPLSEMPEKPRKTRKKPRKIIKPNPYPDLSRYPSQYAGTDHATTTQDRPPSSNSTGSSIDIPLMPPTVFEFPLSISDESQSFVLTRAKWSQASRSSSTYAHGFEDSDSSFTNASVDNNGCGGFEFDDRPLDYPVSSVATQPLSLSLAWSTHSNDTVSNERKRKLAGDYSEENETECSVTRRIVDAPGSSTLVLYDQPVETLGPSFTHKTYGYANPFTGIMEEYPLQMDSYRDASSRDGTLSSNDNDMGVWCFGMTTIASAHGGSHRPSRTSDKLSIGNNAYPQK